MYEGMEGTESTACLLCGQSEPVQVSSTGQFGLPTSVVVCRNCGFSYLDPRWTKERYDRFYATEYDRYYRPEVLSQREGEVRFAPIKAILTRFEERGIMLTRDHVLDLGSGMGHALIHLKSADPGGRYEAIEPSTNCQEHLAANGIGLLSGDVYSAWESDRRDAYDLIIMRHVLEHFHDPFLVLQKAHAALSPNGSLYVAVPNAMKPSARLRSYFFRIVHLSYFSPRSFSQMLRKAGFEIVDMTEGDAFDRHEVFAICKKGAPAPFTPDHGQFALQMDVYERAARWEPLHALKARIAQLLTFRKRDPS